MVSGDYIGEGAMREKVWAYGAGIGLVICNTLPGSSYLTRALLAVWIFHDMLGGTPSPSNSAPRRHREKPKSAFDSSSEIITRVFR